MVRAILFDVFGTVVDWRSGIARETAPFLSRHGIATDPHAFADAWRGRYEPAMEVVRSGRRPFTRLDVLHRENLEATLRDFGADPEGLPRPELESLNRAWHRLDPWPDAVAGLTRLRVSFFIAPLSNGNLALLANMAKRAALPWDAILGAEISGAYKPQPEAYTRTAEVLSLAPAECMLVAAHNGDLRAARAAGFSTGFVPRPAEHGPDQTTDLVAEDAWDVVAIDFIALAGQLRA